MPKELHEISQFITGTITSPSERDIPDDAASYSLNIDPTTQDGVLQGVPEDENIEYVSNSETGATSDLAVNATSMAIINDSGSRDLIYFDDSDDKIKKVDSVESAQTASAALSSTAESKSVTPTMQVNNKEVHIGMGSAEANKPLWAGHIKHSQFGTTYSGLQLEDAELADPSAFPDIYQFVEYNGYLYGIEWQGQYIYKFEDSDTGTFIRKSSTIFTSTQGISETSDGNLWVVDNQGSNTTVFTHKVDTEDMTSLFNVQTNTVGVKVSDILETNTIIYYSSYSDTSSTEGKLYRTSTSNIVAGATAQTLSNMTPYTGTASLADAVGEFLTTNDESASNLVVQYHAPKTCLINVNNNAYIGWGVTMRGSSDSATIYFRYQSGSIHQLRNVLIVLKSNAATSAKSDGVNSKVIRLDTTTDYLSNFSKKMFSITARVGGKLIISFGTSGATTTSVHNGTMLDFSNFSSVAKNANIDLDNTVDTLQLSEAVVFQHDASHISGFSGAGNGQWLRGSATESLTQALEANINLEFSSSNINYGHSGSTGWTSGAKTGFETSGYSYFYKVSFLYDGYQETPLSDEFKVDNDIFAGDGRPVDIKIQLKNLGSFNKRISHINLYRASASSNTIFTEPEGFYRLVDSYRLNASFASVSASSPWSNYREKTVRDINVDGASYEARTGLSEVITNITPNYSVSTQLNNQMFIGNVYQKDLEEYSNYIYKSKPYNFDQYNYLEDFLSLPTTPTALASFNGRIYAFDENNMYQIEPNNLYIEDTIEGKGCISQHSVFVNDYGMCFADKNNIYLHDGKRPIAIGDSILRGDTYSWENRNTAYKPVITFDSFRKSYIIFFRISSSYYSWSYNILRKRWDLWKFHASTIPQSAVIGKEGEMLVSNGTNLVHYLGHASNKRSWDWKSKKLNMRQNTGDKSFKNLNIVGTPTGALNNNSSGGIYAYKDSDAQLSMTSITGLTDINLNNTRSKHLQIQFTAQTSSVDAIGTVFRRHILLSKS